MSIDEQMAEYMLGWSQGVDDANNGVVGIRGGDDAWGRGYQAGKRAWSVTEQDERERLELCPKCKGNFYDSFRVLQECPSCHGTGRRA